MLRKLLTLALVVVAVPASAWGVWGGTLDTAHPQVGAMYFDFDGDGLFVEDLGCSGSYVGESKTGANDVFLTAGHCLPPAGAVDPGDIYVSFSNNASVTNVETAPVSNPIQVVSYHQMPGFGHDLGDLRDLGILLLPDDSVPGSIAPVQLPPAGYLDTLKAQGDLKFRTFDIVGYGVTPIWEPAGPTQYAFDGKRREGTSIVTGLTKAFVRYNQQPHGIGTGSGLCFGDSGSPQLEELSAGVYRVISTTTGGNGQCNANNLNYRVDTPQAREFLGRFLTLP
jgi:Trypsin